MMVSSDHPLADDRVAESIARVLSRYWVDATSGVEVIMSHGGANITYLARAIERPMRIKPRLGSGRASGLLSIGS